MDRHLNLNHPPGCGNQPVKIGRGDTIYVLDALLENCLKDCLPRYIMRSLGKAEANERIESLKQQAISIDILIAPLLLNLIVSPCMSLWPTFRVTCQAKFHSTSKVPFCALICVPTCSTLKIVSFLYLTTREGNRQKVLFFP